MTTQVCEVCGKQGKAASKCTFENCCSCWYGVPCKNGKPMHKRTWQDIEKERRDKGLRGLDAIESQGDSRNG